MKGFIYAAGFGERLRPITEKIPKPLLPIHNIPVICYHLALLKDFGVSDYLVNLHYLPEKIESFFHNHNNFNIDIQFSLEKNILGTGGGLKKCEKELSTEEFFIANSDVISDVDFCALARTHEKNKALATLVLYETPMAKEIGPVAVEGSKIIDFKNFLKTNVSSDFLYTGTAILSPKIFEFLKSDFSSIVYTAYTDLVKEGKIGFYVHRGLWLDIGNIKDYWASNVKEDPAWEKSFIFLKNIIKKNLGLEMKKISPWAKIDISAELENSIVGEQANIGGNAKLKNCLVMPGAQVPSFSTLEDSIIDSGTIIKAKDYNQSYDSNRA